MRIAIASGKGGTGKSSPTAAFASLAPDVVLADCDVDTANLHLLLRPDVRSRETFPRRPGGARSVRSLRRLRTMHGGLPVPSHQHGRP